MYLFDFEASATTTSFLKAKTVVSGRERRLRGPLKHAAEVENSVLRVAIAQNPLSQSERSPPEATTHALPRRQVIVRTRFFTKNRPPTVRRHLLDRPVRVWGCSEPKLRPWAIVPDLFGAQPMPQPPHKVFCPRPVPTRPVPQPLPSPAPDGVGCRRI